MDAIAPRSRPIENVSMLNVKGTAVQKRLQKDSLVVFKAVLPSNEGSWMLGNKKLG